MSARCFLCDNRVGTRAGTTATGDPHGVCKRCGVLACGAHCRRNASYPRIECLICIPALVAASTFVGSTGGGELARELARELRDLLEAMGGEEALIASVEQFLARYPDLADLLERVDELMAEGRTGGDGTEGGRYYRSLDADRRRLLLLAIVILLELDVDPGLLPPPVQRLYQAWR